MAEYVSGQFVDSQRTKTAEAERRLRHRDQEVRELAAKGLKIRPTIKRLKSKNAELRSEVEGLKDIIVDLTQEVAELELKLTDLLDENARLQTADEEEVPK